MATAKAVILTKYGPPEVLVWSDVPMPQPGPGQVRIRVKAAGVSPSDPKIRRGDLKAVFPLPAGAVLGFEVADTGHGGEGALYVRLRKAKA